MSLEDKKDIGSPAFNGEELIRVVYDFAADTGAIADYDVLENTGTSQMIVELDRIEVETALTSGTDFDIDLGKNDGGAEFISDAAKAVFALNAIVLSDTANTKVMLDAGDKIVMGIETATATAGKMHMIFRIKRRQY